MPENDTSPETEFQQAVREACRSVLDDPRRSDVVGVADIESHETVRDTSGVSTDALRTKIGIVLTNAEYAEKVARNKYRIHFSTT